MLKFILASGNAHKAQEFVELFPTHLEISAAPNSIDVEETGETFQENALLKARAYHDHFRRPAMSDDSGLVIEALPTILAVQSARFAPELPDYRDKCERLLELMKNIPAEKRDAYFLCQLCFYFSAKEIYFFEGRIRGKIGHDYRGEFGFGYDPIFVPEMAPNGESLAQLPEFKTKFSHRAKASQAALQFFTSYKAAIS